MFCSWRGLFVFIGKNRLLFMLISFFVFVWFRIIWLLVSDEVVNVSCDGMLVLISLVIMFIDGCWVVSIRWMLVVWVFWVICMMVFLMLCGVVIMRLVNLLMMVIM